MPTTLFRLYVRGMHCAACEMLTATAVMDDPRVARAQARLSDASIEIEGDFGDMTDMAIAEELTKYVEDVGYAFSVTPTHEAKKWTDFIVAAPIAIGFVVLFFLLQYFGIVNVVNTRTMTYGTAFLIGIVASVSTCMAVVGGLLLSLSATYAQQGDRIRPQAYFHVGRLISFFVLGGVIGVVGSVFQIGLTGTFILGILIGAVMLVLGVHLLDVWSFTKKVQLKMPKFVSSRALLLSKLNHSITPAVVGAATFFLPCGFTQAMQIYTLSTGSFIRGALVMTAFALGTLPVLSVLSFSSLALFKQKTNSSIFFKTAGLVVIFFALFNIYSSLVGYGIVRPLFSF